MLKGLRRLLHLLQALEIFDIVLCGFVGRIQLECLQHKGKRKPGDFELELSRLRT